MTLTPIVERLAVELSLPVFYDFGLSPLSNTKPSACGATVPPPRLEVGGGLCLVCDSDTGLHKDRSKSVPMVS